VWLLGKDPYLFPVAPSKSPARIDPPVRVAVLGLSRTGRPGPLGTCLPVNKGVDPPWRFGPFRHPAVRSCPAPDARGGGERWTDLM
jgi:hypothetical protein